MNTQPSISAPSPVVPENGAFRFLGLSTLIHAAAQATNGAYGLVEHPSVPPGFASPYHVHHREDEAFYVIEGELAVILNGQWKHFGPGAYVFGPRGIPHGFCPVGEKPVRMLIAFTPAGKMEGFFRETAVPNGPKMTPEMFAKYEMKYVGPPLVV